MIKKINKLQRGMIWMIMGVKEVMSLEIQGHLQSNVQVGAHE
jgi:hypothetical protein